VSKKDSYISGSTVVRVHQSDKRLAERQAHWRRKRGTDRMEQCVEGAIEGPRLIKRGDVRQVRACSNVQSVLQSSRRQTTMGQDNMGATGGASTPKQVRRSPPPSDAVR
jgi:hypothetical protein